MICNECKSRNPVGNKFCRDCGAKLTSLTPTLAAEEAAREERERLGERVAGLLSAAWTLTEQKRFEQAIPLAREASLLLPDSTAAYALLANLYERTDQEKKAIAAMEQVVALNPDSAADREKLQQLQRGVHIPPRPNTAASDDSFRTERPMRSAKYPYWAPFVAAGAVSALVLGVGFSLMSRSRSGEKPPPFTVNNRFSTSPEMPQLSNPISPADALHDAAVAAANPPPGALPKGTLPPASEVRADPFTSLGIGGKSLAPVATAKTAALPLPFRAAPSPAVNRNGSLTAIERGTLPPIIAVPPSSVAPRIGNFGATESGFGSGERITVAPPTANMGNSTVSAPPPASTSEGYIRITVGSAKSNSRTGSGTNSDNTVSSETALTRARRLQSAGRYSEAASAYQEVLGNGSGSSGDIHQGIAECYRHLNNDSAARGEYQSAISAYEAQAAAGRAVSAAQRGIAACKAALEAMGG